MTKRIAFVRKERATAEKDKQNQGISFFERYLTVWVLLCMAAGILIAVPLIIQTFLIFFIAYLASKVLKLPHNIAAPAGMVGALNFFKLAVAVAIALFDAQSPVALATIVGVLTEVPLMLTLVKIANKTKNWFPA